MVGERWTERDVEVLGREFHTRIANISPDKVTALQLLHAIVARQFDYCHAKFSPEDMNENYFDSNALRCTGQIPRTNKPRELSGRFRRAVSAKWPASVPGGSIGNLTSATHRRVFTPQVSESFSLR